MEKRGCRLCLWRSGIWFRGRTDSLWSLWALNRSPEGKVEKKRWSWYANSASDLLAVKRSWPGPRLAQIDETPSIPSRLLEKTGKLQLDIFLSRSWTFLRNEAVGGDPKRLVVPSAAALGAARPAARAPRVPSTTCQPGDCAGRAGARTSRFLRGSERKRKLKSLPRSRSTTAALPATRAGLPGAGAGTGPLRSQRLLSAQHETLLRDCSFTRKQPHF